MPLRRWCTPELTASGSALVRAVRRARASAVTNGHQRFGGTTGHRAFGSADEICMQPLQIVAPMVEVPDRLIGRTSDPSVSCLPKAGSRAGGVDVERDLPLEDDGPVLRRRDFQMVLADAKVVG